MTALEIASDLIDSNLHSRPAAVAQKVLDAALNMPEGYSKDGRFTISQLCTVINARQAASPANGEFRLNDLGIIDSTDLSNVFGYMEELFLIQRSGYIAGYRAYRLHPTLTA